MAKRRAAFCADVSLENGESPAATASRVDHWILVEYRGPWGYEAVADSGLSAEVKARLREQRDARSNTKLLFLRRPHRRAHPTLAVFWGSSPERGGAMFHAEIGAYEDLLGLDLTRPGATSHDHPLLIVVHQRPVNVHHFEFCAALDGVLVQHVIETVAPRGHRESDPRSL